MGHKYVDRSDEPRLLILCDEPGYTVMRACCDCGLVHRHVYTVENGNVMERVYRANRETSGIRRAMAKRREIVAEPKSNLYVILRRINAKKKPRRVNVKYAPFTSPTMKGLT